MRCQGGRLSRLLGRQCERCSYSPCREVLVHKCWTRLHLRNTRRPFCRVLGRQRFWSGHPTRRTVHLPQRRELSRLRSAGRPYGHLLGGEHSGSGDTPARGIHLRERWSAQELRDQERRDHRLLGRGRDTLTPLYWRQCTPTRHRGLGSIRKRHHRAVGKRWLTKGDCTTNFRVDGRALETDRSGPSQGNAGDAEEVGVAQGHMVSPNLLGADLVVVPPHSHRADDAPRPSEMRGLSPSWRSEEPRTSPEEVLGTGPDSGPSD